MCYCSRLTMVASLAVIGLIRALSIDNQLSVIKNDCYERLAIGQRIGANDVFKTFNYNTLAECQQACTKEKTACRAFSFGISAKGNASCELSHDHIKETVDLKPIGTTSNTDFDLYIKKLDCSVVMNNNHHTKPLSDEHTAGTPKPDTLGNIRPNDKYDTTLDEGYNHPPENDYLQTSSLYGDKQYGTVSNHYLPAKPSGGTGDKVQTVVSVASGPDSFYHPVHEILVSDKFEYGNFNDKVENSYGSRPPYRPNSLYRPYNQSRPDYGPPRPHYDTVSTKPSGGYDRPMEWPEPEYSVHEHRPDCDRPDPYYSHRPQRPLDYEGFPTSRPTFRPMPERPYQPDGYNRPYTNFDNRPLRPKPPTDGYNRPDQGFISKPMVSQSKPNGYDRPISNEGVRPGVYYAPSYGGYGSVGTYYSSYGMSNIDRYDVGGNRPYDMYTQRPMKPSSPIDKPYSENYGTNKPYGNAYNTQPPNDYMFGTSGNGYYDRPPKQPHVPSNEDNPNYSYDRPSKPFSKPQGYQNEGNAQPNEPIQRPSNYDNPNYMYDRPSKPPSKPDAYQYGGKPPGGDNFGNYEYGKPPKPFNYEGNKAPTKRPSQSGYDKPSVTTTHGGYENKKNEASDSSTKPIVSHSIGHNGEQITSIITELKDACFRRVLAGKRVSRSFVRRSLICETVEECQHECSDEKRFSCEGFNYRLDPTGRGKGECELLSVPLSHLDIGRDVYPDPDYDYYERDRNAASVNCKQPPRTSGGYHYGGDYGYGGGGSYYADRRHSYGGGGKRPSYDSSLRRPGDRWPEDYNRRPSRPEIDRRYDHAYDYDYRHSGNRRGGKYLRDSVIWDILCVQL